MICAGVTEWADRYEGEPFHALLCDPPYNFQFMGKDWDNAVAMHPEIWVALSKHLHPGAFVFAFGGARTYHRLAVALEDAGLRIHPAIGWVNGQGFPKSTRVDTQVDKMAGKSDEREIVGRYQLPDGKEWNLAQADDDGVKAAPGTFTASGRRTLDIEAPATPLAQTWEGHRYGGQVLRPCLELIAVAQKPYEGKPVDDITESGAGTLWVEGGRVATSDSLDGGAYTDDKHKVGGIYGKLDYDCGDYQQPDGRWPSNFLLSHVPPSPCPACDGIGHLPFITWYTQAHQSTRSFAEWKVTGGACGTCGGEGVVGGCRRVSGEWECVDGCGVRMLAEQSGQLTSGARSGKRNKPKTRGVYGKFELRDESPSPGSKGTAARYFFQSDWNHEIAERLDSTNPIRYQAKAARRERDIGLVALPLQTFNRVNPGGLEHEPRWAPTEVRNPHPTVKPITLNRYLATLLLPPDIYAPRRLLVPFAGVASEMIGAHLAGWEEVVGVELLQEHCDIGEMRLDWWRRASREAGTTDVKKILKWARKQE